ncbi:MAG: hypothetical protein HN411_06285 [Waddliaceae bacterium]|jgi:hypothetical protein|nr:hypothetical protein [Waddliaceae bacterium]MBT3578906.1 hypothetical protein [Waddliaceae bacterium]MBT4445018.1 hypothetical protein [Waddliaceae bacterium]MBT6929026.1 hypothetical protein [Waddliaceae bacterium]MBT7264025.1 hypothetical protein [Waddliaceae bacterium]
MLKKKPYIIETIVAFILYDIVNYLLFRGDLGFREVYWHPYWVVVLLMPSRYGFSAGVFASIVAIFHVFFINIGYVSSMTEFQELVEKVGAVLPLAFITVGMTLGALRQKYKNQEEKRAEIIEKQKNDMLRVQDDLDRAVKVRDALEKKIVGETSTIMTMYEISKKFGSLKVEDIYSGCLDILENLFQVDVSSLYIIEGGYYVLKASRNWAESSEVEGKIKLDGSIMDLARKKNGIVTAKDIVSDKDSQKYFSEYSKLLAMFPIRNVEGEFIGAVNIEKMSFILFNATNINLMEVIVNWMSSSLQALMTNEALQGQLPWDKEYKVCHHSYFDNILEHEFLRAKEHGFKLTVSLIKIEKFGFLNKESQRLTLNSLIALLKRHMGNLDIIFHYKFDGTIAIISPMKDGKTTTSDIGKVVKGWKKVSATGEKDSVHTELVFSTSALTKKMKDHSALLKPALAGCKLSKPSFASKKKK